MKVRHAPQIIAITFALIVAPLFALAGARILENSSEHLYYYCRDGLGISTTDLKPIEGSEFSGLYKSSPNRLDWLMTMSDSHCSDVNAYKNQMTFLLMGTALLSVLRLVCPSRLLKVSLFVVEAAVLTFFVGNSSHVGPDLVLWTGIAIAILEVISIALRWRTVGGYPKRIRE